MVDFQSIQTTRGWLLTLGTNSGVSEVVRVEV